MRSGTNFIGRLVHDFTLKSTPTTSDELLIGDAAASNALKRATVSSIVSLAGGGSSFDPTTSINPLHYWRASGVTLSGGNVSTITDIGRTAKNFTNIAGAVAQSTDANGKNYIQGNGTTTLYQAGVASDWAFMLSGAPWTMGIVYQRATNPTAGECIWATGTGAGTMTQCWLLQPFTSSTVWGPDANVFVGSSASVVRTEYRQGNTNIVVVIVKVQGLTSKQSTTPQYITRDMILRFAGSTVASCDQNVAYPGGNPGATMSLFAFSNGNSPAAVRFYEMWFNDSAVPDRLIEGYEGWANTTYKALG